MFKPLLLNIFFTISLVLPGIYGAANQTPQPGQPCKQYGTNIAFPGNCTKYLRCLNGAGPSRFRTSELKLEEMECSPDHYFHSPEKGCLQGPCPGCHLALGHNVECTKEEDIVAHPRNCSMYSVCTRNEATCELGEWGRKDRSCPHNRFFDPAEKVCTETAECPQVCPAKNDYEMKCNKEMDTVDCKNCVKKTICVKVETCAAEGFKPYWHLLCPCTCREDNQIFGFRSSCRKYVSCKQEANAVYSFESNECPPGEYLDLAKGHCMKGICTGCPTPDDAEIRQKCTEFNKKIPIGDKCYVCRKAPARCEVDEWVLSEVSKSECFGDCPEADRSNTCTSEGQTIEGGECPQGMAPTCKKVVKCPDENSKPYFTVECENMCPKRDRKCTSEGETVADGECPMGMTPMCKKVEHCPDENSAPYFTVECECPKPDQSNKCTSEGQKADGFECPKGMVPKCEKVEKCPETGSKPYFTVACGCPEPDRSTRCSSEGQTVEGSVCSKGMTAKCKKVEQCPATNSEPYFTVECACPEADNSNACNSDGQQEIDQYFPDMDCPNVTIQGKPWTQVPTCKEVKSCPVEGSEPYFTIICDVKEDYNY